MKPEEYEVLVKQFKQHRKDLDFILQNINNTEWHGSEKDYAMVRLKESIMWLGMCLKALGTPNPYPNSYNPDNAIVDKTADGLKL